MGSEMKPVARRPQLATLASVSECQQEHSVGRGSRRAEDMHG